MAVAVALCPAATFGRGIGGIRPPQPQRIADVHEQLGRRRTDYYSWMKFVPVTGVRSLENLPAAVRDHLLAENAYARSTIAGVAALESAFHTKLTARVASDDGDPPLPNGEWTYAVVYRAGTAHPVHIRRHLVSGHETILLDEGERASGNAYFRTTGHQISPDGTLFAWAEDIIGNDRHRICVRDTASGTTRVIVAADAYGYGGLTFAPSSGSLFWVWRDARNRPTRVYRVAVGGGTSELVYEETDPAIFMQVERTGADGFVAITLSGPDASEVRLVRRDAEDSPPAIVRKRQPGVRYSVEEWDDALIALIEDEQAWNGRIVRLDRRSFADLGELVPHRPATQIVKLLSFESALVRLERHDALPQIVVRDRSGREHVLKFGGDAFGLALPAGQDHRGETCRVRFESPASPPQWIDVDLATGAQTILATQRVAGFDPTRFAVSRVFARARDGELVPITLLTRSGAKADGRAPLMLYGYGAYGVSSEAIFEMPPTVLVENGWNYAIAHVRGGSEKGRRWFLDGRRQKKHNSFDDFIACAEHLCRAGHASEGRIVAYGLSAGGLLVAAAMNRARRLWAGVIAKVPFVDMLNTMSDATHPLVPLFRPDWGDPLADADAYDYLTSISPYENVRRQAYPPLLTTAGLKDDRVGYWEPAKLVAAVRHHTTGTAPALLLTDMTAGHQGSGGRSDALLETARFYAFAQGCIDGRFGDG